MVFLLVVRSWSLLLQSDLSQYTAESVASLPESVRYVEFSLNERYSPPVCFVQERSRIAGIFKAKGNDAYKARDFATAAKLYSRAIEITTKAEPVFYSNRAACTCLLSWPTSHEDHSLSNMLEQVT